MSKIAGGLASVTLVCALLAMAFFTLLERKILAHTQLRKGPGKAGFLGLAQPFADAVKLFMKQQILPAQANRWGFILAPLGALGLALFMWCLYPHTHFVTYVPLGAPLFIALSRLRVYPLFIAGWCSNSKYALLGTVRGVAQRISYEVSISLFLIGVLLLLNNIGFTRPLFSPSVRNIWLVPPLVGVWFVTVLAETNRAPFDFAEGESELVSGFNIEYGGGKFAFIFIAEYTRILIIRVFTAVMFFSSIVVLARLVVAVLVLLIRATLPRYRYDQLIMLTWKRFVPFSLVLLVCLVPCVRF